MFRSALSLAPGRYTLEVVVTSSKPALPAADERGRMVWIGSIPQFAASRQ